VAAVYLACWFDCEDYTSPYEPFALARLADTFARHGLRATWKLVGEEARMLARAAAGDGSRDAAAARAALQAIAAQDLGFHTNWHSLHPTVAEYCTGVGWDEGQRRVAEREGPGLEALRAAFPGQAVTCYGQPGACWAPQVSPVLRRWGIPLYMDETLQVGLDEQPFFLNGVLHVLRLRRFCVKPRGHKPPRETAEAALASVDRIVAELQQRGGGIGQCWWHPNEWYTDEWWDGLNFGRGINHVTPRLDGRTSYRVPTPVPEAQREERFASLAAFVAGLARRRDVRVVGAAEVVGLYPDHAQGHPFDAAALRRVAEALDDELTYQRHPGLTLSAAEATYLLARAIETPEPPGSISLDLSPDGPAQAVPSEVPPDADLDSVRAAAASFVSQVRASGRLPDAVALAGGTAAPATLASAFATAYLGLQGVRRLPAGRVPLTVAARLGAADQVHGEGVWGWSIFAAGFNPTDLIELGRLQAWSLKPALLAP
jgi:hypothetical protein